MSQYIEYWQTQLIYILYIYILFFFTVDYKKDVASLYSSLLGTCSTYIYSVSFCVIKYSAHETL